MSVEDKQPAFYPDEEGDGFKAEKLAYAVTLGQILEGKDAAERNKILQNETKRADDLLEFLRASYTEDSEEVVRARAQRRVLYEATN